MPSYQITITPSKRAAGRFVSRVRRTIQKALAEEGKKKGITQSDVARAIGVNRSVISREIRGHKDLALSRVAEIAWAMGRKPVFDLPETITASGSNLQQPNQPFSAPGPVPQYGSPPPQTSTAANNNAVSFARVIAT